MHRFVSLWKRNWKLDAHIKAPIYSNELNEGRITELIINAMNRVHCNLKMDKGHVELISIVKGENS